MFANCLKEGFSILFKFGREIAIPVAILIALIYIGAFLPPSSMPDTSIYNLAGRWEGYVSNRINTLEVKADGQCSLIISGDGKKKQFYSGKCVIDRSKTPTTLSIINLPAYDFGLYTIIVRMDDDKLLMAPFANRKRARPITFSNSFIMKKQQRTLVGALDHESEKDKKIKPNEQDAASTD